MLFDRLMNLRKRSNGSRYYASYVAVLGITLNKKQLLLLELLPMAISVDTCSFTLFDRSDTKFRGLEHGSLREKYTRPSHLKTIGVERLASGTVFGVRLDWADKDFNVSEPSDGCGLEGLAQVVPLILGYVILEIRNIY